MRIARLECCLVVDAKHIVVFTKKRNSLNKLFKSGFLRISISLLVYLDRNASLYGFINKRFCPKLTKCPKYFSPHHVVFLCFHICWYIRVVISCSASYDSKKSWIRWMMKRCQSASLESTYIAPESSAYRQGINNGFGVNFGVGKP